MSHRRISSRRSGAASLSVSIPHPHASSALSSEPSPRRHRGRHIPLRNPGNVGLFTVSEESFDHSYNHSRCPSLTSNSPYSPGLSSADNHDIYTPQSEIEDPFDNDYSFSEHSDFVNQEQHPAEFELFKTSSRYSSLRPLLEIDTRSVRGMRSSSQTPVARPMRVSSSATTPYPMRAPAMRPPTLQPALPILPTPMWQQQSRECPSLPVTPTSPSQVDGSNLVSALKDLLTTCGEYDEEMFDACGKPEDGQFEDAEFSPIEYTRLVSLPPTASRAPRTPLSITIPTLPPILPARTEREILSPVLASSHDYLRSLSSNSPADHTRSPSLPSLCSHGSLSSASSQSISSISSIYSIPSIPTISEPTQTISPSPTPSPPRKRVSSRRPVRGTLPSLWTN